MSHPASKNADDRAPLFRLDGRTLEAVAELCARNPAIRKVSLMDIRGRRVTISPSQQPAVGVFKKRDDVDLGCAAPETLDVLTNAMKIGRMSGAEAVARMTSPEGREI